MWTLVWFYNYIIVHFYISNYFIMYFVEVILPLSLAKPLLTGFQRAEYNI
jgi:hypothetical protein